ncbi:MAG: dihydrofolate reductase [Burkholderiaceae bacterium]
MPAPRVTLVVARARNGVIGRDNSLPWRLPEDLKHFKATTTGHAIVMGRRTFESIGRALPGRRTIVVTHNDAWHHEGCERAGSLEHAIALAGSPGADPSIATDEVFVVGGAPLFAQALPIADRIVLTEIDLEVDGDVSFPALDPTRWRVASRRDAVSSNGLAFAIVDYHRIGNERTAA